jgi:uncharacterized membrane protein YgcG
MAKKYQTKFQRLNKLLSPGQERSKNNKNKYSFSNDELLKTTDRGEYDAAKLQAQQNKFVKSQWGKVDNELYQNAIHYETTRVGAYADFENMEFYPEISAALDVMMEESTTPNSKGNILNVYSDSDRVKDVLDDLFSNRMGIHTNLPMWARNVCKYGDNFVLLNIDDTRGIVGVKQLPTFEIERKDGDSFGILNQKAHEETDSESNKTRFFWKGKDLIFQSWQIAHFRLLGDDRRLPYGTSVLEKARRIWKQLVLSEDAMLIYRVTRAPERRVYKIFVGNIDNEDVGQYVDEIANKFKRTPITDPKTGQIDLRHNQLAIDQDIFIPVRDENAPNPIDTLAGAQNLDQIADIEYLQRKLFTALRVPKPFLGFEEPTGEGKNLALQDIRFSRTINRIQQSLVQELNKVAIIHLYMLGFEDDLDNFTLTLNNPSTQSDMLKTENQQQKINLYKDSVTDAGNGFAPMSMTRAKREILNWTDDEIKQDILEQRMEKAAAAELENTANVIKHTGLYDKVDRIYGDMEIAKQGGNAEGPGDSEDGGPSGGGGGFGGGGGANLDFDDNGADDAEDLGDLDDVGAPDDLDGGDLGGDDAGDEGGDDTDIDVVEPTAESNVNKKPLITENRVRKPLRKRKGAQVNNLLKTLNKPDQDDILETVKIYDKNMLFNKSIQDMIDDIDKKI